MPHVRSASATSLAAVVAAAMAMLLLPTTASALPGESPFSLTAPAAGSTTTDVRVKFAWSGSCPAAHECRLSVEGTQVKNAPRKETGEFSTNDLDGSYFTSSLGSFGALGPGSERVRSTFDEAGVWYLQLVSNDTYVNDAGSRVTDTHTSPIMSFTVKPIALRPALRMIARDAEDRTFSVGTSLTGNVSDYTVTTIYYRRVAMGSGFRNVKVHTGTANISCYVENRPGFTQSELCTNYVRWDMPRAAWVKAGAKMRVVSVIRTAGWRSPVAVVAQNTVLT